MLFLPSGVSVGDGIDTYSQSGSSIHCRLILAGFLEIIISC